MKTKIRDIKKANKTEKSLQTNAWYSNHIARPISLYVTKPFIWMHPNTICFIMILIGFISLPFFFIGGYWNIIIGALILQIHYIFDHIDGNVARVTKKKSMRGKYLDFIPNITTNQLVLIGLGFGLFRTTGNSIYLLFGISAGFFLLAIEPARLFRYLLFEELKIKNKKTLTKNQYISSTLQELNKYSSSILNYPGIMNLLLIFAIFNKSQYLLFFYGIIMPLIFVARVAYEFYSWKNRDEIK